MSVKSPDSELFFGIVSTVGTNSSIVIEQLEESLKNFNYNVISISVSKDIMCQFETTPFQSNKEYDRITHYMELGNEIRKQSKDSSILMRGVANLIYKKRSKDDEGHSEPRARYAYIINSIKHTSEIEYLRETYGDGFYLIGLSSSKERRNDNLKHKGLSDEEAEKIIARDENENFIHGQHTRDAFQYSDYFVKITEDIDATKNAVDRFVDLIFGNPYITPTFHEYAMFMAFASSLRSADLSRQVGAAIAKDNQIISLGVNDCPKYRGGLYWPVFVNKQFIDIDNGRDYKIGYDSNRKEQGEIIKKILGSLKIEATTENIEKIRNAGINDLTEYGRVVHAEMEALLTCARNNISCQNADLYVTTFPCHNCAKHIIAAGIKRVVYIEPYPKSKAFEFYPNEISDSDVQEHVIFEPFVGVGPQRFIDLFAFSSIRWAKRTRKDKNGDVVKWDKSKANVRNGISLLSYLEIEEASVLNFEEEVYKIKHLKKINKKGEKNANSTTSRFKGKLF